MYYNKLPDSAEFWQPVCYEVSYRLAEGLAMLIEQLYWKTVWNRAVRNQDQGIRHRMPSREEQEAFQNRLAKLANARFIMYAQQRFAS